MTTDATFDAATTRATIHGDVTSVDWSMIDFVGLGALGLGHELAIGLWATVLRAAVLRLRSRRIEPLARAIFRHEDREE